MMSFVKIATALVTAMTISSILSVNAADADEVSVIGVHSTTDNAQNADASPTSNPSTPAIPDTNEPYTTYTYCYEQVRTSGVTYIAQVTPTLEDGFSPDGIVCQIIYHAGASVSPQTIPQASSRVTSSQSTAGTAPSHSNNIRIILPVVLSVAGFILIAGTIIVLRIRSRRSAKNNREWVNRKGGWTDGSFDRTEDIESASDAKAKHVIQSHDKA